ncbi:solute carrier family 32 (vesicular inhibitory amino acid transporter) [Kwoniella heveanensis BCC8398]|uniref:Solute carrier family 32 (Vesicular inhibitory amino acid transporter) n=1 Tax=Kwoniella heveanensis BCC8398 TaxID=1296120 RepID=A0A1B9GZP3_9TREE|nr:solute carrier family 32 (vesicular inhibitory amino acid transporter) [Kwoniella heveanensis BCC8398]
MSESNSPSSTNISSMATSTTTLYDANMSNGAEVNERTRLLGKTADKNGSPTPIHVHHHYSTHGDGNEDTNEEEQDEGEEVEVLEAGKATFSQTLLNVLGDLIGTGILASPIAIAHSGWVLGPLFLCIICGVTLWTLKILIRIIERDRRLRNFADVAGYGLGPTAEKWITALFVGDCCVWLIALIVLFSDTMEAVVPAFTSAQWKLIGLAVIIPLNFVPLRYLSYSSAVGVISTWTLVVILIFTGIATPTSPGSIRHPAPTDLWPPHGFIKLGLSFGLLISGFGGHFLVPNLIRDMKHPEQADRVVEVAYGICMAVYALVAVVGYLMFGRDVSDEVSRDLAKTAAFSPAMAKLAVWMVALNPLTKLPLGLRPLCDVLYTWFGLQPTVFVPIHHSPAATFSASPTTPTTTSYTETTAPPPLTPASISSELTMFPIPPISNAEASHDRRERIKSILRPLISIILVLLFVVGAFVLPSFETVMGIMGGGLAVCSCILIPIAAGAGVWGWTWYTVMAFWTAALFAVVGVVCCFLNEGQVSV